MLYNITRVDTHVCLWPLICHVLVDNHATSVMSELMGTCHRTGCIQYSNVSHRCFYNLGAFVCILPVGSNCHARAWIQSRSHSILRFRSCLVRPALSQKCVYIYIYKRYVAHRLLTVFLSPVNFVDLPPSFSSFNLSPFYAENDRASANHLSVISTYENRPWIPLLGLIVLFSWMTVAGFAWFMLRRMAESWRTPVLAQTIEG